MVRNLTLVDNGQMTDATRLSRRQSINWRDMAGSRYVEPV